MTADFSGDGDHSLYMRLVAIAVAAFVLVLTGDARAGGKVDWSAYLDDGEKLPAQKTPTVAVTEDEDPPAKAEPAAKKGKRGARAAKAKASKAKKVKSRAKSKKKRR
jgi:hypothetical protein